MCTKLKRRFLEAAGGLREKADVEVQVWIAVEELSDFVLCAIGLTEMRADVVAVSPIRVLKRLEYVEKV